MYFMNILNFFFQLSWDSSDLVGFRQTCVDVRRPGCLIQHCCIWANHFGLDPVKSFYLQTDNLNVMNLPPKFTVQASTEALPAAHEYTVVCVYMYLTIHGSGKSQLRKNLGCLHSCPCHTSMTNTRSSAAGILFQEGQDKLTGISTSWFFRMMCFSSNSCFK